VIRALLACILAALALAGVQTWRLQRAQLTAADLRTEIQAQRRQAAEDRAQAVAASASAAAAYRSIEQAWIHKHQEIARDAETQARALDAARTAGRIAGDGLRRPHPRRSRPYPQQPTNPQPRHCARRRARTAGGSWSRACCGSRCKG
jgi:hypothetical protein